MRTSELNFVILSNSTSGDQEPRGSDPMGSARNGKEAIEALKCLIRHPKISDSELTCNTIGTFLFKSFNILSHLNN